MKNLFILLFFVCLSLQAFAQNEAYKKFADADMLTLPYTDNINFKSNKEIRITEADWLNFGLEALEVFDADFRYTVYGFAQINNHKVLLIKRVYREESNHWAVYISNDGRIVSPLNIAYDNSEGSLYIESEIAADKIIVKETNHFDESPTETERIYSLTKTGFEEN